MFLSQAWNGRCVQATLLRPRVPHHHLPVYCPYPLSWMELLESCCWSETGSWLTHGCIINTILLVVFVSRRSLRNPRTYYTPWFHISISMETELVRTLIMITTRLFSLSLGLWPQITICQRKLPKTRTRNPGASSGLLYSKKIYIGFVAVIKLKLRGLCYAYMIRYGDNGESSLIETKYWYFWGIYLRLTVNFLGWNWYF